MILVLCLHSTYHREVLVKESPTKQTELHGHRNTKKWSSQQFQHRGLAEAYHGIRRLFTLEHLSLTFRQTKSQIHRSGFEVNHPQSFRTKITPLH